MAGDGSSNGNSAVAQASRGGRTRLRSVATSVALLGSLNPATGAGSQPQTVALSVCRSPTEKERPARRGRPPGRDLTNDLAEVVERTGTMAPRISRTREGTGRHGSFKFRERCRPPCRRARPQIGRSRTSRR
jgi:hypothetical protein